MKYALTFLIVIYDSFYDLLHPYYSQNLEPNSTFIWDLNAKKVSHKL